MNYPLVNVGTGKRPIFVRPVHIRCMRVLAVLLLLACALAPLGKYSLFMDFAHAAKIPLAGFLLLSGCLFADQKTETAGHWYAAHAIRGGASFCLSLLLLLLFVGDSGGGIGAEIESYLLSLSCTSRLFQLYVPVASLLHFLYAIILCWLITPLFNRMQDAIRNLARWKKTVLAGALFLVAAGVFPLFGGLLGSLLVALSLYAVVYFARPFLISLTNRLGGMVLLTLVAAGCLLLIGWLSGLLNGLPAVLLAAVGVAMTYLQTVLYFWVFAVVFCAVRHFRRFPRPVACFLALVDSMAFELYLVIYIVLNSRFHLFTLTPFWWVNLLFVLLAVFASAFCLNRASRWIASGCQKI